MKPALAAAAVSLALCAPACAAAGPAVTVLFTHDLHARFEPFTAADGSRTGGFARLAALIAAEKAAAEGPVITVDAGDFSSGTLFDSLLAETAPELRFMAAAGYDAVTPGNHDFESGPGILAAELRSGLLPGRPAMPLTNISVSTSAARLAPLRSAFSAWPVTGAAVIDKGGFRACIIGLMGEDAAAHVHIPGVSFSGAVAAASAAVAELRSSGCGIVIALSHSGTSPDPARSEDLRLAREVPGLDLVVSGHTHTVLKEPLKAGGAYIVSAGEWGRFLGKIALEPKPEGGYELSSYSLLPNSPGETDGAVGKLVAGLRAGVEKEYLAPYDLAFDEPVAASAIKFARPQDMASDPGGYSLGDLAADAFRCAVPRAEGPGSPWISAAFLPLGTIRDTLPKGVIKPADVFNVLPLSAGPDGRGGSPLAAFYLTGADLARLAEAEATIARGNTDARLQVSGLRFSWSAGAAPFARVREVLVQEPDGGFAPAVPGRLYRVAMSFYAAGMLNLFFQPPILPRGADGEPVPDLAGTIVRLPGGRELKEWVALQRFLSSFEKGSDGLPQIPDRYSEPRPSVTILP